MFDLSPPRRPAQGNPSLPGLTGEDSIRWQHRWRVHQARGHRRRWLLLWLLAGPGILAMLGENDGPSMIA